MKTYKVIIIAISLFSLGLTSCGGASKKNDTHTHENCTGHHDHSTEKTEQAAQESFKVEADTLAGGDNHCQEHEHHDCGHDHGDGKNHKH